MVISHWLYPVQVLGPGNRLALWVQGCKRKCKGCISPELQDYNGTEYDNKSLANIVNQLMRTQKLDGITISGGEPFEQKEDLLEFCSWLSTNNILIYTGYTYQEVLSLCGEKLERSKIGVLITNPYIEKLNDDIPLRGSTNQEIIYLNPSLRTSFENYIKSGIREQQLFVEQNTVYFAGIPRKGTAKIIRKEIDKIVEGGKNEY